MVAKRTEKAPPGTPDGGPAQAPAAPRATPAKKTVAKKAAAKKAPAAEPAAKKSAAKKTVAEKTTAKKTVAEKTTAKKTAVKKSAAHADGAGNTPGADRTAPGRDTADTGSAGTGVGTVGAEKSVVATEGVGVPGARPGPDGALAVRPGEDPWTPEETSEARAELQSEVLRLGAEIAHAEESITGLMRDGAGAGDDEADTGNKNITREHELALAANAREMLEQTERALERLDAGTYGLCESCGKPIGKARMQAFSRATLCVECKQREERRH
ncbi:TraR/DksA C4-type zinc finger protein [Streptomyces sp. BI20]|uniref:TraR/DksA family transcriptional regulator n=1 Tax=Streptomyces sp. BI20 TaxID=3403460 RepID=UPI003C756E2C